MPVIMRCRECGWEGDARDIPYTTVYEDYGDVVVWKCPECGRIDYDGMEMFEEVEPCR